MPSDLPPGISNDGFAAGSRTVAGVRATGQPVDTVFAPAALPPQQQGVASAPETLTDKMLALMQRAQDGYNALVGKTPPAVPVDAAPVDAATPAPTPNILTLRTGY